MLKKQKCSSTKQKREGNFVIVLAPGREKNPDPEPGPGPTFKPNPDPEPGPGPGQGEAPDQKIQMRKFVLDFLAIRV